jgi:hypothetical protein
MSASSQARLYNGEFRTNGVNSTKPEDQEFIRLLIEQVHAYTPEFLMKMMIWGRA